jgi:arginyl-tRNA synthetase
MLAGQITKILKDELGDDATFDVSVPSGAGHGDYASNAALVIAGRRGDPPMQLAEQLAKKLSRRKLFTDVQAAQPGFLNFTLAPDAWADCLKAIIAAGKDFGRTKPTGKRVELEFISANPTGPLTLANGRGGFGGDVLGNVLERAGWTVEREYYLNDAGNQIAELGASVKGTGTAYSGPYVKDLAKHLDTGPDAMTVGREAAQHLRGSIESTVARMNIRYDTWFSEDQQLHQLGKIEEVLGQLEKSDATYEKDGALWLKTTDYGDDKDRVLRKQDGSLTYLAADVAHYYHKFAERKFDLGVLIVGADHHGYLDRMNAAVEQLRKIAGFSGESRILITQMVRLIHDGKEVKMSKRAGTYVALDDLLDEIPADVARFFFVMKSFDTHMDFDLTLAKEQSQKNPVYYLKYAHARICGILKKAPAGGRANLNRLTDPAETNLIKELLEYPHVITETAADYQVQRIAHYGLDLADVFHKFYERCPVISEDATLTASRLKLLKATQLVMQQVGETLGIEMPERM